VVWDKPVLEPCPRCGAAFVTEKVTKRSGTVRRCAREGCGWQARLDEDEERWVEMAAPRAAARVRRGGAAGTAARAQEEPGAAPPRRKKAAAKVVGTIGGAISGTSVGTAKGGDGKATKKAAPARSGGRARRAST
jgi:DNA topoisomerase-1